MSNCGIRVSSSSSATFACIRAAAAPRQWWLPWLKDRIWVGRRRDRVYATLRDQPAFMAGIWGGFAATVIGALSNDSGPVIFALGFLGLLFATAYAWGRPLHARSPRPV